MMIRMLLATGLGLIALTPRLAAAADNTRKKAEKNVLRLAGKCAKEAAKDLRDAQRERTHPRKDSKWDALCAPAPLPPPVEPPVVEPPAVEPPAIEPPAVVLPPGVMLPPPPPPA